MCTVQKMKIVHTYNCISHSRGDGGRRESIRVGRTNGSGVCLDFDQYFILKFLLQNRANDRIELYQENERIRYPICSVRLVKCLLSALTCYMIDGHHKKNNEIYLVVTYALRSLQQTFCSVWDVEEGSEVWDKVDEEAGFDSKIYTNEEMYQKTVCKIKEIDEQVKKWDWEHIDALHKRKNLNTARIHLCRSQNIPDFPMCPVP